MDAGAVILTTPEWGHTCITVTPSGLLPNSSNSALALPLQLTQKTSLMTTKLSAGLAGGRRPANPLLFPSPRPCHHSQDLVAECVLCSPANLQSCSNALERHGHSSFLKSTPLPHGFASSHSDYFYSPKWTLTSHPLELCN